jgi:predicted O-methyltransferase YrrM
MRTFKELKQAFVNLEIQPTKWLGDSPQRFDTYQRYAGQVNSIVEFGVYTGLSTCAWLMGHPKKLRSYDITDANLSVLDELKFNADCNQIDFEFALANSLEIDIEPCDLLFIDTVHKYDHCLAELNRHGEKAQKYIVLHDPSDWPGVFEAVAKYLHQNRQWHIIEHCNQGSGLLVLERYCD